MPSSPLKLPFPLLLKPTLLSARNKIIRKHKDPKEWFRNALLLLLTSGVILSIYFGGIWVLKQVQTQIDFVFLPPSLFLGLILVFLLLMLLMTNTASALGCLFFGKDLDIILSAPISQPKFFFGKLMQTLVTSSWMTIVFLAPAIALFGSFYHASFSYYGLAIVILIPYFLIPAALSLILATAVAVLIPLNFRRELILAALAMVALGFYALINLGLSIMGGDGPVDAAGLVQILSFFTIADVSWSPSNWAAVSLGEILVPSGNSLVTYLGLAYSATCFICGLSYLVIRCFHWVAYTRTGLSMKQNKQRNKNKLLENLLTRYLSQESSALVKKEFLSVMRDMTQSVQALLLFSLSALYLYLLNFQHLFQTVIPDSQQQWWKLFLIIINICLESFIITAIGTRLVYPSLSREGASFWVLQNSPITFRRLLTIKFSMWFMLVVCFTSVIFGTAAALVFGTITAVIAKLLLNFFIALGLVGLGIGLGAYFINLNWDHPSELIAGFGSLVYMLLCVALITSTIFLTLGAIYFSVLAGNHQSWKSLALLGCATGSLLAIPLLNYLVARWALRLGGRYLESFE
jgi:hypothetical protein